MSGQYDNRNRAVLFKNKDKRDDKDPDYRGSVNVDGKEHWLDFWLQTAKTSGEKFMSGRVKPKMASEAKGGTKNPPAQKAPPSDDFDDAIPF